jgi:hypothetical protein
MRELLSYLCSVLLLSGFIVFLPVGPPILFLVTGKKRFLFHYFRTIKAAIIHMNALVDNRSVYRFFFRQIGEPPEAPARIGGRCSHCGNCCLSRKCIFLENSADGRYLCGIYDLPVRKLTNCGQYPVSQRDIDMYACPTYYVIREIPITPRSSMTPAPRSRG